jgi:hypothetical protein
MEFRSRRTSTRTAIAESEKAFSRCAAVIGQGTHERLCRRVAGFGNLADSLGVRLVRAKNYPELQGDEIGRAIDVEGCVAVWVASQDAAGDEAFRGASDQAVTRAAALWHETPLSSSLDAVGQDRRSGPTVRPTTTSSGERGHIRDREF